MNLEAKPMPYLAQSWNAELRVKLPAIMVSRKVQVDDLGLSFFAVIGGV